jgi:hypothetical protein
MIENIAIAHGDGLDPEVLEDEAVIYTGLPLEDIHVEHADNGKDGPTVQDVFDSMTEEQKNVVYFMIGEALSQS